MARRKVSRKFRNRRKLEPAVETMLFSIPGNAPTTIDLSQNASILNRRFYRQGLNWAVAGFTFITDPNKTGTIAVAKIPNTWVARNAWVKGFEAWREMNENALEESESIKPKFLDFKVFMDEAHHTAGVSGNAIALMGNPALQLTVGEWEYSKYHIPNTAVDSSDAASNNPRDIVWTGANYVGPGASGDFAVSLIEGYAASRLLPEVLDPNTPDDAASVNGSLAQNWLAALDNDFDQQTGEVLFDMISENNQAPYPYEGDGVNTDTMYPGGANQPGGASGGLVAHDQVGITGTTIGNTTKMSGTNFYGGLIRIQPNMNDATPVSVLVHLVPGPHRGYLAEPMKDV